MEYPTVHVTCRYGFSFFNFMTLLPSTTKPTEDIWSQERHCDKWFLLVNYKGLKR